jgi:transcriptional repressor NrdR
MTVIDSLVEDVERELVSSGCKEYPSSSLGDLIMAKLLKVDPVSYVRFASFYWNFEDIESFVKNLQKKDKKPGETAP